MEGLVIFLLGFFISILAYTFDTLIDILESSGIPTYTIMLVLAACWWLVIPALIVRALTKTVVRLI